MAIKHKTVTLCNRCDKEETGEVTPNITVLGETFYLCDFCMTSFISCFESFLNKDEIKEKKDQINKTKYPAFKIYSFWDEYRLEKLLSLRQKECLIAEIAKELGCTVPAVSCELTRIRQAKPGSDLYHYRLLLEKNDQESV